MNGRRRAPPKGSDRARRTRRRTVRYTLLILFAAVGVLLPFWTVLINSAKILREASVLGIGLPSQWHIGANYSEVITKGKLFRGLRNNLLIVIPATAGIVLFGSAAAWAFARSRSRRVTVLYWMCISGILIPPAIVTSVVVLRTVGLYGTRPGIILFYMGVYLSFGIFLMTGFVKTIPIELEEAGRIEGAGSFAIYRRIILPLLAPVLVTVAFISVLFIWNDFFYAFFLIRGQENLTLSLGLFQYVSGILYEVRWNLVFASIVLTSLPLIILFGVSQRYVVSGLLGTIMDK